MKTTFRNHLGRHAPNFLNAIRSERTLALRLCDILVEIHELSPDSFEFEQLLKARLSGVHRIQRLVAQDRQRWCVENDVDVRSTLGSDSVGDVANAHRSLGRVRLWMRVESSHAEGEENPPS